MRVRTLIVLVLGALLVASPAAADPAGPTHYDSTVTEVVPENGGPVPLDVEVLGGDAFLAVHVEPGTEVLVPGYEAEPYVRISADGTVAVNQRSPARWLNDARYGEAEVEVPAQADAEAPPQWETVGDGGSYAWHDHRIHFMSPALPEQVDPTADTRQHVYDWAVPVEVDGRSVEIAGTLDWVPGPSVAVPVGLLLLLTALALVAAARGAVVLGAVHAGTGVAALALGVARSVGLPPGAEADPALLVLSGLAVVLALGGLLLRWRDGGGLRGPFVATAAGIPLLVWGVLQAGALTRPIVPGPVGAGVVRVVVAAGIAAGLAALFGLVRLALSAASLDEATEPA